MHEGRVIYDPTVIARPYGCWCETCGKVIGACTSQQDAADVLANHQAWKRIEQELYARTHK